MLVSGQSKVTDLSSLLMINSVATAFRSLLRPSDLMSHEKGPAESLSTVITDVISDKDFDTIDKVIQYTIFLSTNLKRYSHSLIT